MSNNGLESQRDSAILRTLREIADAWETKGHMHSAASSLRQAIAHAEYRAAVEEAAEALADCMPSRVCDRCGGERGDYGDSRQKAGREQVYAAWIDEAQRVWDRQRCDMLTDALDRVCAKLDPKGGG